MQLSAANEARVRALVENGSFDSADDVVESALLLLEQDQDEGLGRFLDEGEDDIRAGRTRPLDASVLDEVLKRAGLASTRGR